MTDAERKDWLNLLARARGQGPVCVLTPAEQAELSAREGPFYHGGVAGLQPGDAVVPAPSHVEDGCPICEAKRAGRACTVGEYRGWLRQFGARAEPVLSQLRDAPPWEVIDPPRAAQDRVYITRSLDYATWYAARSRGDLYEVRPRGDLAVSPEDHFPSFLVASAVVVRVLRRSVVLTRTERRRISHQWRKADRRVVRVLAREVVA